MNKNDRKKFVANLLFQIQHTRSILRESFPSEAGERVLNILHPELFNEDEVLFLPRLAKTYADKEYPSPQDVVNLVVAANRCPPLLARMASIGMELPAVSEILSNLTVEDIEMDVGTPESEGK